LKTYSSTESEGTDPKQEVNEPAVKVSSLVAKGYSGLILVAM
jgi:hypothetical protein